MENCEHTPIAYGASQVLWTDRQNGIGTLIADCSKCGQSLTWKVSAE